ncbi:FtsK/SpoIIIE family DNA translocase [Loigolactobacillus bifermentans]|uniref:Cell division DNA translocase FtsK n=1 Tax=Loigolactobacillus bifermentans DSM 20003 TaxID=1423726 RepID=A0A0R1H293_9LACO|nr:DNA translocase FtsK [Loigolactobacillus bifermentans]KRK40089.1 cell division DNA translocase FtsK [Loigolactobacillus bifermentans DSM 20003]QGG60031.1 cell division protein FtsK [Loigolactobacillus bifermentans]
MATQRKSGRKTTKRGTTRKRKPTAKKGAYTPNGLGFFFGLISVLAFFKWGFIGNLFANCFRFAGGDTYHFLAILLGIYGVYLLLRGRGPQVPREWWLGGGIAYISLLLLLNAILFRRLALHNHFVTVIWHFLLADFQKGSVTTNLGGGMIGAALYQVSYFLISPVGTYLLSGLGILIGLTIFLGVPLTKWLDVLRYFGRGGRWLVQKVGHLIHLGGTQLQQQGQQVGSKVGAQLRERRAAQAAESEAPAPVAKPVSEAPVPPAPAQPQPKSAAEPTINVAQPQQQQAQVSAAELTQSPAASPAAETPLMTDTTVDEDYVLPQSDLLQEIPPTDQSAEYQLIKQNSVKLKQTFDSFGIDVDVKNVNLGPAVTKYEIKPAIGVKVSKIVSLTDDLALALAAKDVRIEAPIPGKSLIGIEVPNQQISTVSFRDIIEAQPPHPGKLLDVPVGRDISGKVIMVDLTKMPHLLIAGSTGSGKSVMINDIITGILMTAKPHEVKLMMIDPKKVELSVYNGVPHLMIPVVTDAKKAAQALHKVVAEMERRYELFAQFGKRNITEYNQGLQQANQTADQPQPTMPYIVAIVDELADLMMVASNEVEDAIVRLAQMGRAAGIHMILATQRPSVDVITGLIKANVPSRMAFAVSSGVDSRTIIDSTGAEKLLGRGDMLYLPIDQNKPTRVQGAFIAAKDVEAVVNFIKQQQTAEYDERMIPDDNEASDDLEQPDDELFPDAVQLVAKMQTASVSMLQRRFRIGYNRAARMIDEMEQRGIVGPSEGSKPRKVYLQEPTDEADSTES